ncbi:MAG: sigma-70 family RNA polymerase sigma factor [SAR324 cluster bacterium]|nr:sigma-70 family RNA polymerase sigma factor [SAR324 cluster bacterium]
MLTAQNSVENPGLLPTDQSLIERILKGDIDQFDVLVTRYRNQVYRFVLKFINDPSHAEDLAQDTFIAAFQNLSAFQGNAKFSTWLLGIARNKALNDINRAGKRRSQMVSDEILQEHQSTEASPLEAIEQKQDSSLLKEALDQLDPDLKDVLISISMEGFSYEEFAELRQIPIGTVKSKLYRARMMLKKKMQKKKYEHF